MDGISGSVKTMSMRDLVLFLGSRQLSGTLQCERDGDRTTVEVRHGDAVRVSSTSPRMYLSELLVERGYINETQVQQAIAAGGHPLGRSLVAIGAINEGHLREALTFKISDTLMQVMNWNAGWFQFVEDESSESDFPVVETQVGLVEVWRESCQASGTGSSWMQLHQMLEPDAPAGGAGPSAGAPTGGALPSDFAETFRREVEDRLSERGRGKRFPKDLQCRAVDYYRARTQQGSFLSEVARELGLPPPTLRRWVLDAPPPQSEARGVQRGQLSIQPGSGAPVLVGPGGLRIEGLDLESLAQLLRRL